MALNLLPKGTGRRRAIDKLNEVRRDLSLALSHLHAAGDEIALLRQDLSEARGKQAAAEEIVVQQQADIDDLTAERDDLLAELLRYRARFGAQLAAEANANRITVPPMQRIGCDQDTQSIDVTTLCEAAAAGRLGAVADPGRINT